MLQAAPLSGTAPTSPSLEEAGHPNHRGPTTTALQLAATAHGAKGRPAVPRVLMVDGVTHLPISGIHANHGRKPMVTSGIGGNL